MRGLAYIPGKWRADLYTWEMEGWPKYLGDERAGLYRYLGNGGLTYIPGRYRAGLNTWEMEAGRIW